MKQSAVVENVLLNNIEKCYMYVAIMVMIRRAKKNRTTTKKRMKPLVLHPFMSTCSIISIAILSAVRASVQSCVLTDRGDFLRGELASAARRSTLPAERDSLLPTTRQ